MLALTQNATDVIRSLVDRPDLPDSAGLRIAATDDGSKPLSVATAAGPRGADQIIEEHGARVFIDASAADMLDHQILDAQVTDQGIQFRLANQ